jgi:serine protease Do
MDEFNKSENVTEASAEHTAIVESGGASESKKKVIKKMDKKGLFKYFAVGLAGALIGSGIMGFIAWDYINRGNKVVNSVGTTIYTKDNPPTTVEAIAELDTPAVVGITTVEIAQNFFNQQVEETGVGSGVVATSDGYIITNEHVVANNPKSINVSLKDGRTFPGKKIWGNPNLDLAVIKIEADGLQTAVLGDSDKLVVGELAVAIGNPLGMSFERSVTAGIVSALNRSIQISSNAISEDLIQTDASINPGNSGGPLINKNGEVIGINSYKINSSEGLGFAIPINVIKPIINQIEKYGSFRATAMGVSCVDREMTQYYTNTKDITLKSGILIIDVQTDSGAAKAGLIANDIITKVDGIEVNTMLKLREVLYSKLPGDTVKVEYTRDGTVNEVDVTLSADTSA